MTGDRETKYPFIFDCQIRSIGIIGIFSPQTMKYLEEMEPEIPLGSCPKRLWAQRQVLLPLRIAEQAICPRTCWESSIGAWNKTQKLDGLTQNSILNNLGYRHIRRIVLTSKYK